MTSNSSRAALCRIHSPHGLSRLSLSLASALSLMVFGNAQAQSELPPVQITGSLPEANGRLPLDTTTETGSRLGLTPRQTPATVNVVDRKTIEERGAQNTQEALRAVPGVTAHDAPGSVGVSYRGFGSGSLSQMFNGITVQYSIAARPVDSWIYDRVEAIGGPSSFLFGSGAVGGSINYITKLPERTDFSEARLRAGSAGLVEGSFGLNRRIAGDPATGSAHYLRLDGNFRQGGNPIDGVKPSSQQLAASLLSDISSNLRHTLAYEYQKEKVDRPYWGTPVLNPAVGELRINPATRFKNYNSADGIYEQQVQWLRSITEWSVNSQLSLKNTFYGYDALRDYRNVETYTFNAANAAVARSATLLQRHDQGVVGNRMEGIYKSALAGLKSDWAFGLDYSLNRQTRFPNSLSAVVSTVDPINFSTENFFSIAGMKPGFVPDRDNKVKTLALYLENRTQLRQDVSLLTGLRHDQIQLDLTNQRAVTAAAPASYSRSYKPTTGRVGLVWDVVPGANLYAQYATAADPPSGILSTASFADVMNNSALTTGRQLEVGSKANFWDGKGTASVALYSISRKNIAMQDPSNTALTILVGEQTSKGAEFAMGLQPTAQWSVQANYTHVKAQYEKLVQGGVSLAGKTPTNTPSNVANLWTSYAVTPSVKASVGVRYVDKVYGNAANTTWWPSYTLVDLGLAWKINKTTSLTARVRNATDKVYAASVGSMAYLGAGRTADLTLQASF